jgi:hypothetical protein
MPSNAYFEELTTAVLVDADEVKGFLHRQSPAEHQEVAARMHERVVATFTKLLEVELEHVGQLGGWQERVERVRRLAQGEASEATVAQEMGEMEAFVSQALPHYDAFLLKAGLRIRKAFVGTLTQ